MRKHLLPAVLILLLGLGAAVAQTFTRALQLSQDTTGAFSVDNVNGVYFPGHIYATGTGRPVPTVTGTGTPTISGNDTAGLVTMGASATTATVVFGTAYLSVPWCVVTWQNLGGTVTPAAYTLATTSIAITQGTSSSNKINYFCTSLS